MKITQLFIFVAVFAILAVVYVIYWVRLFMLAKNRKHVRIPFLISNVQNNTLSSFLNSYPSRKILLIYGSYESGKTSILDLFEDELENDERFFLSLDLDNVNSFEQLIMNIRLSIFTAFVRLSKRSFSVLSDRFGANDDLNCLSESLKESYRLILDRLSYLYNGTDIVSSFSEIFRIINRESQFIRPVFFIRHIDSLLYISNGTNHRYGEQVFDNLLSTLFSEIDSYASFPVLIEIKDSLLRMRYESGKYIEYVETEPFHQDRMESIVTSGLVSSLEMGRLLHSFGNHPGSIMRIMNMIQCGLPIDDSINNEIVRINKHYDLNFITINQSICLKDSQYNEQYSSDYFRKLISKGLYYISEQFIIRPANLYIHQLFCNK